MDATNLAVLAELQEYAQLYFDAIKEHNTTDGVCELRPGHYSAKELADREKAACGAYRRPVGDIFDEEVSISVDTFRMRFPYREIFYILARWEAMCRPGKSLKSVFTVGDVEEKTAKVLLCEQTELGKYKTKGMKLQHLTGNWWAPRKLPKCDRVDLVYELNGVMFLPGTQAWSDDISNRNSAVMKRCAKLDDAKTTEALLNFIATQESAPKFGYFVEVSRRAGVNTANTPKSEQPATPAETPQISTEAAETVNVSAEGEKEAETKEMPRCECPNYADYAFERGWSIENTDFDPHSGILCMIHFDPSDEKYVCGCLWQINSDKPNYTEHRRFKTLKGAQNYGTKRMGMKLEYQTLTVNCSVTPSEPPQSPETPQTVDCATDTPKPRETARKPQNRGIGNTRHSGPGTGGYAMLDNASATLAAMSVPHECSTAAYW